MITTMPDASQSIATSEASAVITPGILDAQICQPEPRTLDEWDALDAAVRDLEVLRLAATIGAQLRESERRWPRRTTTAWEPNSSQNELESELDASIINDDVQRDLSQTVFLTELDAAENKPKRVQIGGTNGAA